MTGRLSREGLLDLRASLPFCPRAHLPWHWPPLPVPGTHVSACALCAHALQDPLLDPVRSARLSPQMPLQKNSYASRNLGSRGEAPGAAQLSLAALGLLGWG